MWKKVTIACCVVVFALPVLALAEDSANAQIIALYTKLVELLKQELMILQGQTPTPTQTQVLAGPTASLSIAPMTGSAPLDVMFTVTSRTDTEAVDYGDGHSSGSAGCPRNAKNWCDLSKPVTHTYTYPGTYKVTLYDHPTKDARVVLTSTVTVSAPAKTN